MIKELFNALYPTMLFFAMLWFFCIVMIVSMQYGIYSKIGLLTVFSFATIVASYLKKKDMIS